MYAESFVMGGEFIGLHYGLIRHLPLIFRESRARPTCTMELKSHGIFLIYNFFAHLEEGEGAVKESESVMNTHRILSRTLKQIPCL